MLAGSAVTTFRIPEATPEKAMIQHEKLLHILRYYYSNTHKRFEAAGSAGLTI